MVEEWRPVVGWEQAYEVSNLGRVRNPRFGGRLVKQFVRSRYVTVHLKDAPRHNTRPVHLLVLEAFVGPRPPGMECCHWDNDRSNNQLFNLRWDTKAANKADQVRHGTASHGGWGKRKSHCSYGHRLVEPNLDPWHLAHRGMHVCQACHLTRGLKRAVDFQTESDRRYALIMERRGRPPTPM